MPSPIKPVHTLDLHQEIFDFRGSDYDELSLSNLQNEFLGGFVKESSVKISTRTMEMLRMIEQSQDDIVTAAQSLSMPNRTGDNIYKVPVSISDHELLGLKTAGLILGSGRSVTLTEKGRVALRDYYLNQPVNEFRKARTKNKFDLNAAKRVASEESNRTITASKFKRNVN